MAWGAAISFTRRASSRRPQAQCHVAVFITSGGCSTTNERRVLPALGSGLVQAAAVIPVQSFIFAFLSSRVSACIVRVACGCWDRQEDSRASTWKDKRGSARRGR